MQTVDTAQASGRLAELIDAAIWGEEIVLADQGRRVRLVPLSPNEQRPTPKFGSHAGRIVISDDFDEPLEDFREYMEPGE